MKKTITAVLVIIAALAITSYPIFKDYKIKHYKKKMWAMQDSQIVYLLKRAEANALATKFLTDMVTKLNRDAFYIAERSADYYINLANSFGPVIDSFQTQGDLYSDSLHNVNMLSLLNQYK